MREYTEIVILCEDRQQEVFARHFLIAGGVHKRRIRSKIAPHGQGSGEQFVRAQYPAEVKAYRSRKNHLNIALVVMIDADTFSVTDRRKHLDTVLADHELAARASDERIGIFIPKRNIETWIYYLQGKDVTEDDVYPHLAQESACKPFVVKLAENRHDDLPDDAPPSLKAACAELERVM